MSISQSIEKLSKFKELDRTRLGGLPQSAKTLVLLALQKRKNTPILAITSSSKLCLGFQQEAAVLGGERAEIFPAPDERAQAVETTGKRLECLKSLLSGDTKIFFAPAKAMAWKTSREQREILLSVAMEIGPDELCVKLVDHGYARQAIVGEKGEFCVRGGLIDIFPSNGNYPVRIEFFGERIESLRAFDPQDQRSINRIDSVDILPAVEKAEVPFLEMLPRNMLLVVDEPLDVSRSAEGFFEEIEKRRDIELSSFLTIEEEPLFESVPEFKGDLEKFEKHFEEVRDRDKYIVSKHKSRLAWPVVEGQISCGFTSNKLKTEVYSDREIFAEQALFQPKAPPVKEGVNEALLADLKMGDFVVHENYGVGVYRGMRRMELEGVEREYILLEYLNEDRIYVPLTMMGLIEKYSSGGDFHPRLSNLRTKEWHRTRDRVKSSIKDMTEELLEIYAAREKNPGYAFAPDDVWQSELSATFPYQETPDQARTIKQVKDDMEAPRPMDRLVCGDVGYGKTEVALRAAAKAASVGKQVAILVPTTLLAEQHYNNFKERFKTLPFSVEMLSRFRSRDEQKKILKQVDEGLCDVVIGTHRLLQKDVNFKCLGLVIVDEEQRFGVRHKEKLKKLRKTVDVLTLSATPIPRTLYLSLAGVRDLSTINTPPLDRSPIRTYVLEWSDAVVREAILKELDRGGQVYFVYNIVEKMQAMLSRLRKLVPEARITMAHGQMNEKKLETTMMEFLARKHDVLLCSTIIESGIDIPTVNTVLIDHANRFGLAQLYQLRGRVGRSTVRAYSYLFYHKENILTETAVERLKAIQEFTALGSGYKLAMRDLEIRGSGNLLGAQQSGHIAAVGFDLYCELLEEAVREIKGITDPTPRQVVVEIKTDAYIPSEYIDDERQRLALYRRMNLLDNKFQIDDMKRELEDRFGRVPGALKKLFNILYLKVAAKEKGVREIREKENFVHVEWFDGKSKSIKLKGVSEDKKLEGLYRAIG
ncbi:MAG: transcription-repair coupling factor [Candidatus Margulisbacteria bacterium]|nr:transcription-repair coupling factor [Candidatus Margulisiibacteriota bacterium]